MDWGSDYLGPLWIFVATIPLRLAWAAVKFVLCR
jgi:hypothetical protein